MSKIFLVNVFSKDIEINLLVLRASQAKGSRELSKKR